MGRKKKKAIAKIFGDWEEFYQRLRKLLLAYLDQDSGIQYNYHTIPRPLEGTALLRYVLGILSMHYCIPILQVSDQY